MHGHVLVAFLESVVLFDVVQVISPDDHGPEKLKKYILAKIQNYEKKISKEEQKGQFLALFEKRLNRTFEGMDIPNWQFLFWGLHQTTDNFTLTNLIFPNFITY